MRRRDLQRLLQRALLAGAPVALGGCLACSSCLDNGSEPPLAESREVDAALAEGGELSAEECVSVCDEAGTGVVTCVRASATSVLCLTHPFPCEGRRAAGLKPAGRTATSAFALHLAETAWLEAASVHAFTVLRRELREHGAPRRLLRAASRSARDERRHARSTKALARHFGVPPQPARHEAATPRALGELALENAVEGCVRETWGALVASHQAVRASERLVRATMSRVAPDELRHAELAWAIHRWVWQRLSAVERRRVLDATNAAVKQLTSDVRHELPNSERARLGLPSATEATRMLAELDSSLWRSADVARAMV